MSDSVWPHRRQPTRLPHPWDSLGKNTGVGCHFLLQCMKVKIKMKLLSHIRLLVTPWTAAYQTPLSMGFSRQEYWSGVPLPSPKGMISMLQKAKLETRCRPPYSPALPEDICSSFQSHLLLLTSFYLKAFFGYRMCSSDCMQKLGGILGHTVSLRIPREAKPFVPQ